jgi:hypothetical protein
MKYKYAEGGTLLYKWLGLNQGKVMSLRVIRDKISPSYYAMLMHLPLLVRTRSPTF